MERRSVPREEILARLRRSNKLVGSQPKADPPPVAVLHEPTGHGRVATCAAAYDLATPDEHEDGRRHRLGGSISIRGAVGRLPLNCGYQIVQLPPAP